MTQEKHAYTTDTTGKWTKNGLAFERRYKLQGEVCSKVLWRLGAVMDLAPRDEPTNFLGLAWSGGNDVKIFATERSR